MTVSTIDGTIEQTDLKTDRAGIKIFRSIRFRLADGSEQTIEKSVVTREIGDQLTTGAKGRFYLYNAFDTKGVHGIRTADGRVIQSFPGNNQKIFLIAFVVSALWVAVMLVARGGIPLLGAATLVLSGTGWYFMGKGKAEAKAQFDADAGYPG
jgi:hypothetical protein